MLCHVSFLECRVSIITTCRIINHDFIVPRKKTRKKQTILSPFIGVIDIENFKSVNDFVVYFLQLIPTRRAPTKDRR